MKAVQQTYYNGWRSKITIELSEIRANLSKDRGAKP